MHTLAFLSCLSHVLELFAPVSAQVVCQDTGAGCNVDELEALTLRQSLLQTRSNYGSGKQEADQHRIFPGHVANASNWPGYVSFRTMDRLNRPLSNANTCGGALIADKWVLTARHCYLAYDRDKPSYYEDITYTYKVGVKFDNEGFPAGRIPIETFYFCPDPRYPDNWTSHDAPPEYHGYKPFIDCALVKLSESALDYGAEVAPMYRGPKPIGHSVTAVGMGSYPGGEESGEVDGSRVSGVVRSVAINVLVDADCSQPDPNLGIFNGTYSVCAGEPGKGKRTGSGDSGGPLFIFNKRTKQTETLGVVSGGVPIQDQPRLEKDGVSRFLFADFVADWVDEIISKDVEGTQ